MLSGNQYGHQLRDALRGLEGFGGILGSEFPHQQRQLSVARHVDGSRVNSLYICRGTSAASVYFHNKFDVFHNDVLSREVLGDESKSDGSFL
jgi:hypothetical protein